MGLSVAEKSRLIAVAKGEEPATVYLEGGELINVYSGEILPANVALCGDRIAYVGTDRSMVGPETTVLDVRGRTLVPGYLEPHAHPWVLYNPLSLWEQVVPLGTTTIMCDNLFSFLLTDPAGYRRFMEDFNRLGTGVWWMIRSLSQSFYPGEAERFSLPVLEQALSAGRVASACEITRWPEIYAGREQILEKIAFFESRGLPVDGHTAGCSYERLNALAAAGLCSCHEAITAGQVLDRLRLGLTVMLRHSSLRPDLLELLGPLKDRALNTSRILLTTDGPAPTFIAEHGCVDYLISLALEQGIDPVTAYQMGTLNGARYFGMESEVGGIAPGRKAHLNVLSSPREPRPVMVLYDGRVAARGGIPVSELAAFPWGNYRFASLTRPPSGLLTAELFGVPATGERSGFPVMDLVSAVITRRVDIRLPQAGGIVQPEGESGLGQIALLSREWDWISSGIIRGFAGSLDGLASSYNTAAHLLVVGRNRRSMALALNRVAERGGGIALADGDRVVFELPLDIGGFMSTQPLSWCAGQLKTLLALLRERGYPYHDILYTLLFLVCDFLPELRLTRSGLYDVKNGRVLLPARTLRPLA